MPVKEMRIGWFGWTGSLYARKGHGQMPTVYHNQAYASCNNVDMQFLPNMQLTTGLSVQNMHILQEKLCEIACKHKTMQLQKIVIQAVMAIKRRESMLW